MIQIPGYLIRKELGRGGMATVYLALQASLEREVAIKVMMPALADDPNFSRRFLSEARTLASLSHPNIVAVYDVGVTPENLHYFSMQLLPGGDLAQRIQAGMKRQDVVSVLHGIGRALAFAHQRGFVHRDVSPANVLFDAGDHPVLTDFGIARAVTRNSRLTHSGVSVGTSLYMSPEQARGWDVDARSDLYSLGVVAYELLTGKPPFRGDDGFAVAFAHVFEPIPKLPEADQAWQSLIEQTLAKDPNDRFPSAESFLEALGKVAGQPAEALPETEPAPLPPPALSTGLPPTAEPQASSEQPTLSDTSPVHTESSRGQRNRLLGWTVGLVAALFVTAAAYFILRLRPTMPSVPQVAQTRAANRENPLVVQSSMGQEPSAVPLVDAADPALDRPPALPEVGGDLAAPPTAEELLGMQQALATTVQDPITSLLGLGRTDVAAQRLGSPPGRNASERFRLALRLAERFKSKADAARAREGLVATAKAYLALAEKVDRVEKNAEFMDFMRRGIELAASVPEGAETARQARQQIKRLHDEALAQGREATARWDATAAAATYALALAYDPESGAARQGAAQARRIGLNGYAFRDRSSDFSGPEMIVVTVSGKRLAVARNEATVAEYRAFWDAQGSKLPGIASAACRDREGFFRSSRKYTFASPQFAQGERHPAVCVSHAQAEAYAAWLSNRLGHRYRLPTLQEWKALLPASAQAAACTANAADRSYRTQYRERGTAGCDDGYAHTAPVRSFAPLANGLYDVVGNVREWVQTCVSGCREHVAAGTSWAQEGDKVEAASAKTLGKGVASNTIGIRVVREID